MSISNALFRSEQSASDELQPTPPVTDRRRMDVALLSLRNVRPVPWYGGLVQAEDVLVACLGARLHTVEPASGRYSAGPLSSMHVRRAIGSSHLGHPYVIAPPAGSAPQADVLIVCVNDLHDASALVGTRGWHELGRITVVYITEVSRADLRRYPEVARHLCRRTDHVFVGTETTPLECMRRARVRTVAVVPPLLDVLAFPSRSEPGDRPIDVFNVGRRCPAQHALLKAWASAADRFYLYDSNYLATVTSLKDHRELFAATASRSRVFITNFARFDQSVPEGGTFEVGTRFYEAMAAGCVLAGELPNQSLVFQERISSIDPISFPLDSSSIPADLRDVLNEPAHHASRGRSARATALRHHDAAHRWQEMAVCAGLPIAAGIDERIAHLSSLADELLAPSHTARAAVNAGGTPAAGAGRPATGIRLATVSDSTKNN